VSGLSPAEGFPNIGADYVIVHSGSDERLGLATERHPDHVVVRAIGDDGGTYVSSWPPDAVRAATKLEIYRHGKARLKAQPLGSGYGADAGRTMWDVMSDRDRDYWCTLRPTEGN
jgi:hypothetical protein